MKKRPCIKGKFHVLVVPESDMQLADQLTIPLTMVADGPVRVVAKIDQNSCGASLWAFDKRNRNDVCKRLRELADFIETHGA